MMKNPEVPPPALCGQPLIETPRPAIETALSPVNFKSRCDVLTAIVEFIPRIKWRHSARRNTPFEFQFHKP
jgi:hypothetical protein